MLTKDNRKVTLFRLPFTRFFESLTSSSLLPCDTEKVEIMKKKLRNSRRIKTLKDYEAKSV